jgi:hypothetical protein
VRKPPLRDIVHHPDDIRVQEDWEEDGHDRKGDDPEEFVAVVVDGGERVEVHSLEQVEHTIPLKESTMTYEVACE